MRTKAASLTLLSIMIILSGACKSVPESIPENLEENHYFRMGAEASEKGSYEEALLYYNAYLERFSQNRPKICEAQYEIALIHYRTGKDDQAAKMFTEILKKYENPTNSDLPTWIQTLSQKILLEIESSQTTQGGSDP